VTPSFFNFLLVPATVLPRRIQTLATLSCLPLYLACTPTMGPLRTPPTRRRARFPPSPPLAFLSRLTAPKHDAATRTISPAILNTRPAVPSAADRRGSGGGRLRGNPVPEAPPGGDSTPSPPPTTYLELSLRCRDLPNTDVISKTDPFVVLFTRAGAGAEWEKAPEPTETVHNCLSPAFVKCFDLPYGGGGGKGRGGPPAGAAGAVARVAAAAALKMHLSFEVYDRDSRRPELNLQEFVGSADTTVGAVLAADGWTRELPLANVLNAANRQSAFVAGSTSGGGGAAAGGATGGGNAAAVAALERERELAARHFASKAGYIVVEAELIRPPPTPWTYVVDFGFDAPLPTLPAGADGGGGGGLISGGMTTLFRRGSGSGGSGSVSSGSSAGVVANGGGGAGGGGGGNTIGRKGLFYVLAKESVHRDALFLPLIRSPLLVGAGVGGSVWAPVPIAAEKVDGGDDGRRLRLEVWAAARSGDHTLVAWWTVTAGELKAARRGASWAAVGEEVGVGGKGGTGWRLQGHLVCGGVRGGGSGFTFVLRAGGWRWAPA